MRHRASADPRLSGIHALRDGREAFAARVNLANSATRAIDCQYYIWRNDLSGTLLLEALLRAARRGVRVRLLLDDHNTAGLDDWLAALAHQPSFEVRLFNPHRFRRWRILGLFGDFARLNRRMHNKSFTVDRSATIVGGRNVGDEYFAAHEEIAFIDLDVLAVGQVVDAVSRDFEAYWSSASSVPVRRILPAPRQSTLDDIETRAATLIATPAARAYADAIASSTFMRDLEAGTLPLEWTRARLVSDLPAKGLRPVGRRKLLIRRLRRFIGEPRREMLLISAYFVPTRYAVRVLLHHARRGVRVTVLTNSLEATDVAAVHAGYARHRKRLLRAGIRLFEMKRTRPPRRHEPRREGSSASNLHAKAMCVDRAHVFVGSLNFDARSVFLNTEMGIIIDSATLAASLAGDEAMERMPLEAYEVGLTPAGKLQWIERLEGGEIVHERDPHASMARRLLVFGLSLLHIDWLL